MHQRVLQYSENDAEGLEITAFSWDLQTPGPKGALLPGVPKNRSERQLAPGLEVRDVDQVIGQTKASASSRLFPTPGIGMLKWFMIALRHNPIHDKYTNKRESLETDDKDRANELLVAHNEAAREPAFNLQKARVYLAASDAQISKRTWRVALKALIESKKAGSANRDRWETCAKNKGIQPLLDLVLIETRTDQVCETSHLTSGGCSEGDAPKSSSGRRSALRF